MKVTSIWEIPDTGTYKGGKLYDKFGNFDYFADTSSLADETAGGTDVTYSVKQHTRYPYMRAKAGTTIPSSARKVMMGVRLTKGALPGYTVTLESDVEKRDFQYTGTMSCLYAWLTDNAKVATTLYGPSGTPYEEVPAKEAGFSAPNSAAVIVR